MFSYDGADEKWNRRVLRIPKDVLSAAPAAAASDARTQVKTPNADTECYIRHIVKPLLGPYVDIPEVIHLEWEFLAALRDRTVMSEGVIPPPRRHQWTRSSLDGPDVIVPTPPVAHLMWNYRHLNTCPSWSISMEIKPKAGYTAISPLVHPDHRVKFRKTRFEILQQLYCNGYISKGWDKDSNERQPSLYNPLDMFSGDASAIKRALDNLVVTPQNNLRVWFGETPLLNANDVTDNVMYEKVLSLLLLPDNECEADSDIRAAFVDLLTTLASLVLVQEELLEKLLGAQRLDIVDADGAILIYERLREFCGDEADELLDNVSPIRDLTTEAEQVQVMSKSPFPKPSNCAALDTLLQEIEVFSSRLHDDSSQLRCTEMDEAFGRCKRLVNSLTKEACVYLLQNWLLSLAMCDVSIFLMIHPISSLGELGETSTDFEGGSDNGQPRAVCCCQNDSSPGVLVAKNEQALAYTLKVVDCDRKPASKLCTRREKEKPIRFYKVGEG